MTILTPVPNNFINGTIADATLVDANFAAIVAGVNANAAENGVNASITQLVGLTTPISPAQGGGYRYSCGTSTGINTVVVTSVTPLLGFSLIQGAQVSFTVGATNTGPATLAVNGTAAAACRVGGVGGLVAFAGGEQQIGDRVHYEYDGTFWVLIDPTLVGMINAWPGTNAFTGPSSFANNTAALFNGSASFKEQTLVVTTGVAAWDMSQGPNALLNLTLNTTLANPTNQVVGESGILRVLENGTGGWTLAVSANYKVVTDAFYSAANTETEYFYKVVAASGANSIELRAKTRPYVRVAVPTTSGTSANLLNVPSWVTRITLALNGISTNGASAQQLRLGTSGAAVTSGYDTNGFGAFGNAVSSQNSTTGITLMRTDGWTAASLVKGSITLHNVGGNTWEYAAIASAISGSNNAGLLAGTVTLAGALDSLFYTTLNGTDAFDAGGYTVIME